MKEVIPDFATLHPGYRLRKFVIPGLHRDPVE